MTRKKEKKDRSHWQDMEQRYQALFEASLDAIFVEGSQGEILECNQAACKMFGYTREEILQLNAVDLVPQTIVPMIPGLARQGQELGELSFDSYNRKKDGTVFPVQISFRLIDFSGQKFSVVFVHDITARRQTQEALVRSEERYRVMSSFSTDYAYSQQMLPDGSIVREWETGSLRNICGYTSAELEALGGWAKIILPDDAAHYQRQLNIFNTRIPHEDEIRIQAKNGDIRWVSMRSRVMWDENHEKVERVLTSIQDITRRKHAEHSLRESEERYRIISQMGADYSFSMRVTREGLFQREWLTGAFTSITGYTPEEYDALGGWQAILHPEDVEKYFAQQRLLLSGHPSIQEYRIITRMGMLKWLQVYCYPMSDDRENRVNRVYGVVQDITRQKQDSRLQGCLFRISEAASRAPNLDDLYRSIHSILGELMVVDNFYIAFLDPRQDMIRFVYFVDQFDETPAPKKTGRGLTEYVLRTGEPILVTQEQFEVMVAEGKVEDIGAPSIDWMGAPLKAGEETLGVMVIQSYDSRTRYSPRDLEILSFVSTQIGSALQRKAAEEELEKQSRFLREALDAIPNNIFVCDREGRYLLVNQTTADFHGAAPEEMVGRLVTEFIQDPKAAEGYLESDRRIMDSLEDEVVPRARVVTHTGKASTFEIHKRPLVGSDGKADRVLGVGLDISRRIADEEELRLNGERLEVLLKLNQMINASEQELVNYALEEAIRLTSSNIGYIAEVNEDETELKMISWSRTAMEDCRVADKPVIYPMKEVGLWGEPLRRRQSIITNDYSLDSPLKRGIPQGHIEVKRHLGIPIIDNGRVVMVAGIGNKQEEYTGEDARQFTLFMSSLWRIIERKRAEEALRSSERRFSSYFRLSLIGIAITSPEKGWIDVNDKLCDILGYSREELKRLSWADITPAEDLDDEEMKYEHAMDHPSQGYVLEKRYIRKDGKIIHVAVSATPVLDADGNVEYFLALVQDITERKQREVELESIAQLTSALRTAQNHSEMQPIILEQLLLILRADAATLMLVEPETGEMAVEVGCGLWKDFSGTRLHRGEGVSNEVLSTGKIYITTDIHADERFVHQKMLPPGKFAAVAAPLNVQGSPVGVLWVARTDPFAEHEIRLVKSIADMAANALHRATLHEETTRRLRRLNALHAIDEVIASGHDLHAILQILLFQTQEELGVSGADILLLDAEGQHLDGVEGIGSLLIPAREVHLDIQGTLAGRAVSQRQVVSVPHLDQLEGRVSPELRQGDFTSYHAAPLLIEGKLEGVLEVFHDRSEYPEGFHPTTEWLEFLDILAGQAAIAVESVHLFKDLQRSNEELSVAYDATIAGWSRALELRDMETEGHSQRVTEMTVNMARLLSMSEDYLPHLRRGALLHDIGKMGIPDAILLKPGPLTPEEWEIMRQHPSYAYQMLSPIQFLSRALDIPYLHHERWDGSGYPLGLAGEEIPLAARIFSVVDVWDALTSDRPYRPAWSLQQALDYIREGAGKSFDPRVVEVFLKMFQE